MIFLNKLLQKIGDVWKNEFFFPERQKVQVSRKWGHIWVEILNIIPVSAPPKFSPGPRLAFMCDGRGQLLGVSFYRVLVTSGQDSAFLMSAFLFLPKVSISRYHRTGVRTSPYELRERFTSIQSIAVI